MDNASTYPCAVLERPQEEKYSERIRQFQGCPTLAVTRGGRIYLGWYAGGTREPHMDNYNLLIYSDDQGRTWSDPLLVIPSSKERLTHALDIQLFTDPEGILHVCWVQNNTLPAPAVPPEIPDHLPIRCVDGYLFNDTRHAEWEILCRDPDAETPVFTEPRYLFPGFLRCKPTFLASGDWLYFNYDQLGDCYAFSLSADRGETFTRRHGAKKCTTVFDETMAYQREDGSIRMLARCKLGQLAESTSCDGGRSWSETVLSGITAADSRFFISRLPSGRILLVHNDHPTVRCNMTVRLSEDDGRTWKYKKRIDDREGLSYPDADFRDGTIYLTYDRGRTTHREILFAAFTEEDIIEDRTIPLSIVSKP